MNPDEPDMELIVNMRGEAVEIEGRVRNTRLVSMLSLPISLLAYIHPPTCVRVANWVLGFLKPEYRTVGASRWTPWIPTPGIPIASISLDED